MPPLVLQSLLGLVVGVAIGSTSGVRSRAFALESRIVAVSVTSQPYLLKIRVPQEAKMLLPLRRSR
jgi:hypothetical protein